MEEDGKFRPWNWVHGHHEQNKAVIKNEEGEKIC